MCWYLLHAGCEVAGVSPRKYLKYSLSNRLVLRVDVDADADALRSAY